MRDSINSKRGLVDSAVMKGLHKLVIIASLIAFPAITVCTALSSPILRLHNIKSNEEFIEFESVSCTPTVAPSAYAEMKTMNTDGFQLLVDLNSIKLINDTFFNYDIYLHALLLPNGPWIQCKAQVTPRGASLDRYEEVNFDIIDQGQVLASDKIDLPVPRLSGAQQLLTVHPAKNPTVIDLSSANGFDLIFENRLRDMSISVRPKANLRYYHTEYWKTPTGLIPLGSEDQIVIKGGTSQTLRVNIEPRTTGALLSTFRQLKEDEGVDTLSLDISYTGQFAKDFVRTISLSVPVRFLPSLLSLGLFVAIGSILANLARQLSPEKRTSWGPMFNRMWQNCLLSMIGEVVAICLVRLGSKVVLLGFDLDPLQTVAALMLGFLVSGGAEFLDSKGFKLPGSQIFKQPGKTRKPPDDGEKAQSEIGAAPCD